MNDALTAARAAPTRSATPPHDADLTFEIWRHPAPTPPGERARPLLSPGFSRVFVDHMVTIRYAAGCGWHDAQIGSCEPIPLNPIIAVLHYTLGTLQESDGAGLGGLAALKARGAHDATNQFAA
ncbi:hypothetical protein [uncultured Sphingomonas sp.]|uniref:hypothetical protein n=1 Tax=uncultured Sphingomonas sp. TaxID=158754 RepID=UPI0035CB0099